MKRSQLRKLVLEVLQGSSKYYPGGKTPGLTPDVFNTILKNVALGKRNSDEEDSEEERVKRGNAILDKANPENVDRIIRGEKPIYEDTTDVNDVEISYIFPGGRFYGVKVNGKKLPGFEASYDFIKDLTGLDLPTRGYFDDKEVLDIVDAIKAKGIQANSAEMDVS